jgi:ribonuclease Y
METWIWVVICVVAFLAGEGIIYILFKTVFSKRADSAQNKAKKIIEEANDKALALQQEAEDKVRKLNNETEERIDNLVKSAKEEARKEAYIIKQEAERETKERKSELAAQENRLNQREENLERRDSILTSKETALEQKQDNFAKKQLEQEQRFADKERTLDAKIKEVEEKENTIEGELSRVANLSIDDAKKELMQKVEDRMEQEVLAYMKNREDEAKEEAEAKARDILGLAIDKYSQEVVSERTVSSVALPSDEMKGRIIGREGRNIRTLEQMLGVDIIIDDTPEVISVSCFDPIRRETARLALELLIKDGRIQPGRIEEIVEKAKTEVQKSVHEAGINAAFKLGLPRIHKELLDYVGRLKYRTSYGQNVLDHSIQVAYLCGIMASELGLDIKEAQRCGLLHDIGKSCDFEMEGSHIELGVRLAKKYGEDETVINAIEAHHGDVECKSVYAHLVIAADTLSAARPGARSETLENYIKRLEDLEAICKSFDGVKSSFAMQSGREVRVMVEPDKISDLDAYKMAREIKDKIESTMTYPGQIKVAVIRELRAEETAK